MAEQKFVKVACGHPNGLHLRLGAPEPGKEQRAGILPSFTLQGPSALQTGVQAPAAGGEIINEVPAEFWAEWIGQNRGKSPFLETGLIREIKDDDEGKPNDRSAESGRHL